MSKVQSACSKQGRCWSNSNLEEHSCCSDGSTISSLVLNFTPLPHEALHGDQSDHSVTWNGFYANYLVIQRLDLVPEAGYKTRSNLYIKQGRRSIAYFARRIDLFLQPVQARLFHAFYFLDDGYVRAPFTTHRIFEPSCPHLQTRTARGGTLGPTAPAGGFAIRSKSW